MQASPFITKGDFLRYLKCPLYAWLWKNKTELREDYKPSRLSEQGDRLEEFARKLFKPGIRIKGWDEEAVQLTEEAIKKGAKVLYEGAKMVGDYLVRADILKHDEEGWHLYEVKTSTRYKDKYFADICYQYHIFKKAGFPLASVNLIIIDKKYVYDAKKGLEVDKFLICKDVTEKVKEKLAGKYEKQIIETHDILKKSEAPKVPALRRNFNAFVPKKLKEYYYKDLPELSVYDISGIGWKKLLELEALGIRKIVDIPEDFSLPENQKRQVKLTKEKGVEIDGAGLEKSLSKLEYPLYFLDYEAITPSIPIFDGTKPNERIPCQYSLHVIDEPNGRLRHMEYLHQEETHPVKHLLASLREHMGDKGSVLVWNSSFESAVNRSMGSKHHEYADFMKSINERMHDLMKIVRDYYIDYRFKGSISIKNVLPVINPKLSYKDLEVHSGGMAMDAILDLVTGNIDDRDKAIKDLLTYCQLDTLAMVEIYKHLKNLI